MISEVVAGSRGGAAATIFIFQRAFACFAAQSDHANAGRHVKELRPIEEPVQEAQEVPLEAKRCFDNLSGWKQQLA